MRTIKNKGFLLHLQPVIGDHLSNGLYQFIVNDVEHAQSVVGPNYPITIKNDFLIIQYSSNAHIRIDKTFSTTKSYLSFAHYTDTSTEPKNHVYYQPDGIIHNPDHSDILLNAQDAQQIVQLLLDARKKRVAELDQEINAAEQRLHQPKAKQKAICQDIYKVL
jgi:hypothetical protein